MVRYKDECVCCGLPCYGNSCPNRNVPHVYCDVCGEEMYGDDINLEDDYHICDDCRQEDELCDTCANHYMDDCGWCCKKEGDEGCEFWHEDVKTCALYKEDVDYD